MKKFLDRLPGIITAKPAGRKRQGADTHHIIAMLLESILQQHVVAMRYHSWSSAKEKEYVVHPYRLAHVQGGLYLIAYVPGYKEVRTFAVERIRSATRSDKSFEPIAEFDADPFTHSLGAYRGTRTRIKLVFHPQVAAYIKERTWHASQGIRDRADGSVAMTIDVSDDYALRSWILSFGRLVRVASPPALASWVLEELDGAREQYVSGEFSLIADDRQPGLPFGRLGEG
jgi:predicted DNA-binding transcriptional regulator YafY